MAEIYSINPRTEQIIGVIPESTILEVDEKITNAKSAFESWANLSLHERIGFLEKISQKLEQNKIELIDIICKEVGKPEASAQWEVNDAIKSIHYYMNQIPSLHKVNIKIDEDSFKNTKAFIDYTPYGVIGLITPWNYPCCLSFWTIAPALLSGNTIVYKPSEYSSFVGRMIYDILDEVLPHNVFNIVIGSKNIGKYLVESDIDKLFFTGSVNAGHDIVKNIGIKAYSLELGGKDAFIVCEDADIEMTTGAAAWGAFTNAGQVCTSLERCYVHEDILEKFVDSLIQKVSNLTIGKDIQPLISNTQLEKVQSHLEDANNKGCTVLIGGKRANMQGYFFEPTILVDVDHSMKIMKEETFGPILPIMTFTNEDEAVDLANDSKYGLSATIWTKDIEKGNELSEKIKVGMAFINEINFSFDGGDYWGGIKESGNKSSESKLMQCLMAKSYVVYSGSEKRSWWY
jgi:succinate-semialdehyde dehydrogenase/glutarate-semialdehyde dehydrogenase